MENILKYFNFIGNIKKIGFLQVKEKLRKFKKLVSFLEVKVLKTSALAPTID